MKGLSVILPVKPPEPYVDHLVDLIDWTFNAVKRIPYELHIQYEEGLTNAVIKGVERSKFDIICVMDADGSHLPYFLPLMYLQFQLDSTLDLVVGSKLMDYTSLGRRFISWCFRSLARFLLKLDVRDPMSGFVMGKIEWFRLIEPSDDYKFLLQLLCFKPPNVMELPISFHKRRSGKSKANWKTGLRTLGLIYKLWRKRL